MSRPPRPAAGPLFAVIGSAQEALAVSRAIAADFKRLKGRARLARTAELEDLLRALDLHVQNLEAQMQNLRAELGQSQRGEAACLAYEQTGRRR